MRLIFLDIDGVLNSQLWFKKIKGKDYEDNDMRYFNPEGIELLNDLIKHTQSKVVISSTWRLNRSVDQLKSILEKAGFKGDIIDKTPSLPKPFLRGNEIYQWMADNKDLLSTKQHLYRNYVILDDDSDMLYWQRNNFFLVDGYCGLTPNLVYKIKNFFDSYC